MEWSCAYILRDFFGSVHRLAWKPLKSLEFVTVSNDNSVRMWRLAEDEQGIVRVSQVWGTRTGGIVASGAIIRDVVGLSKINQDLLIQRGATDGMTNESNISDSVGDSMEGDTSE
ncbi:hypothetical protein BGX29_004740 [Mortierella sp. GBA35]|nr:hypothetical protein BGX29_004740 [Mortierella sp. GBA35]